MFSKIGIILESLNMSFTSDNQKDDQIILLISYSDKTKDTFTCHTNEELMEILNQLINDEKNIEILRFDYKSYGNYIWEQNSINLLVDLIKKSPYLKEFDISDFELYNIDMKVFENAFANHSSLEKINFMYCGLISDQILDICSYAVKATNIREIILNCNLYIDLPCGIDYAHDWTQEETDKFIELLRNTKVTRFVIDFPIGFGCRWRKKKPKMTIQLREIIIKNIIEIQYSYHLDVLKSYFIQNQGIKIPDIIYDNIYIYLVASIKNPLC